MSIRPSRTGSNAWSVRRRASGAFSPASLPVGGNLVAVAPEGGAAPPPGGGVVWGGGTNNPRRVLSTLHTTWIRPAPRRPQATLAPLDRIRVFRKSRAG